MRGGEYHEQINESLLVQFLAHGIGKGPHSVIEDPEIALLVFLECLHQLFENWFQVRNKFASSIFLEGRKGAKFGSNRDQKPKRQRREQSRKVPAGGLLDPLVVVQDPLQ